MLRRKRQLLQSATESPSAPNKRHVADRQKISKPADLKKDDEDDSLEEQNTVAQEGVHSTSVVTTDDQLFTRVTAYSAIPKAQRLFYPGQKWPKRAGVLATGAADDDEAAQQVADEAETLETLVFGKEETYLKTLQADDVKDDEEDEAPEEVSSKFQPTHKQLLLHPAWLDQDEDVEQVELSGRKADHLKLSTDTSDFVAPEDYQMRLKRNFAKSQLAAGATPGWAQLRPDDKKTAHGTKKRLDSDDSSSSDDDTLLTSTGCYLAKPAVLPQRLLSFKQLRDVSFGHRSKKPINSVQFHRNLPMMLSAGEDQTLRLFKVDGKQNELMSSVAFDRFPIDTAQFSADGRKVFVGSRFNAHFYCYDMESAKAIKIPENRALNHRRMGNFTVSPDGETLAFLGRFGEIHLLSAKSYEWLGTLKMNGDVSAAAFSEQNPTVLYSHGDLGQVYLWDVKQRSCMHRFNDDGCVKGTSIAISAGDTYLACGSNTGVVNLYDASKMLLTDSTTDPKPLKSVMNLTTAAEGIVFNPPADVLALWSTQMENSVKLLHSGSRTVYANFPERTAKLKHVRCIDFSKNSGYMVGGNDVGNIMLFRLHFYSEL